MIYCLGEVPAYLHSWSFLFNCPLIYRLRSPSPYHTSLHSEQSFFGRRSIMYPSSWTISENSSCWGSADVSSPTLGPFHTLTSDDIAIEVRPSIQVDYFSHNWKDEELWASWRYLAAWKHSYSNGLRLEYASWRTWAKTKYNLKTVPPEILDW